MRKFVLSVLVITLLASCENKESKTFTVSGVLHNAPSKVVYIEESDITTGQKTVKDSSTIAADGKFSISLNAKKDAIYNLLLQNDVSQFVTVINDASKIKVDADFTKKTDFLYPEVFRHGEHESEEFLNFDIWIVPISL